MCEIFKDKYVSLYSVQREEPQLATVENQIDEDLPTINNIEITENDLTAAIKELMTNSSSGSEGIPAGLHEKRKKPSVCHIN